MHKPNKIERINLLAKKLQEGIITPEEKEELEQWYTSFDDTYLEIDSDDNEDDIRSRIYANIVSKAPIKLTQKTIQLWKIASAVAAVFLVFFGLYFLRNNNNSQLATKNLSTEITPGNNKATLTLDDGSVITLDSANNGEIAQQSGIKITKTANGELVYSILETSSILDGNQLSYNTISTPRGGQYQIILPDGTHVWLNASSSLKFPTTFKSFERKVELIGEAYFEVVSNKKKPFKVLSDNQLIEVLGTHFNVNAYPDEQTTKTTLLEGSVKVSLFSEEGNSFTVKDYKVLKPGQQAKLLQNIKISQVDTEEAVAWKNGELMFSSQDIKSVLRQISRWYNVDVIYEDNVDNVIISGSISKYANIHEVLEILQLTGNINFKISGRRIIVKQ